MLAHTQPSNTHGGESSEIVPHMNMLRTTRKLPEGVYIVGELLRRRIPLETSKTYRRNVISLCDAPDTKIICGIWIWNTDGAVVRGREPLEIFQEKVSCISYNNSLKGRH